MLKKLYRHGNSPKLSKAKYDDLLKLSQKNIIPTAFHSFYKSLPVEK